MLNRKAHIHKEIYQLEKEIRTSQQQGMFDQFVCAWNAREKLYEELIQLDIQLFEMDND